MLEWNKKNSRISGEILEFKIICFKDLRILKKP